MNRENEGDLIIAADTCTPMQMAQIVRYSSGVVCVAMEGHRMDELKLPPMVTNNQDPKGTAFSVSVDATKAHGKNYSDKLNTCRSSEPELQLICFFNVLQALLLELVRRTDPKRFSCWQIRQ
jgi:3,4-dihydroxy-2-butanone 4-phosphate synthase